MFEGASEMIELEHLFFWRCICMKIYSMHAQRHTWLWLLTAVCCCCCCWCRRLGLTAAASSCRLLLLLLWLWLLVIIWDLNAWLLLLLLLPLLQVPLPDGLQAHQPWTKKKKQCKASHACGLQARGWWQHTSLRPACMPCVMSYKIWSQSSACLNWVQNSKLHSWHICCNAIMQRQTS